MKNALPCTSILAFLVLSGVVACSASKTSIPLTWRNPGYEGVIFTKLLVIGVGQDEGARRLFEDEFAEALSSEGARAEPSWGLLPQSTRLTREEVAAVVQQGDFDAVIVTRVLSVDKEQEYVKGKSYTAPSGYYGSGYYGYYATSYAVVHEPGYFKTNTIFRLETNLYAVSNGGLVWSGQSDTLNPSSISEVIDSMTKAVSKALRDEKLIP